MATEAALVISWGSPVRGRESKSIEVFMESLQYWGQKAAEGRIQEPQAFAAEDGSGGMVVLRGDLQALRELNDAAESRRLLARAQLIIENLHAQWYLTGDALQQDMSTFAQAISEILG